LVQEGGADRQDFHASRGMARSRSGLATPSAHFLLLSLLFMHNTL
jgi:hypothetical protein